MVRSKVAPGRELLLVRHAKSAWDTEARSDFDRPLKKRGRKDAPRVGRRLAEEGVRPDLVLVSPAKRARETALLLLEAMEVDEEAIRWERRLYGAEAATLLEVLAEVPVLAMRVMLVGHNPGLEDLLLRLVGRSLKIPEDGKLLPTCAVARLAMPADWGRLPTGSARLLSLARPRDGEEGR